MKQLTEKQLILITALLSLALSLWLSYSNDVISRDSTLYMRIAQKYLESGFIEAFKLWSWPFYSVFFAIIHKISGLNLEHSAYLLNAILEAIVCVSFVKIYAKIAFKDARLWVAALFILTFISFNNYRGDIIRGYGFWAFTLLAVNYYLSFYQSKKKLDAIKWQLSIFLATLFRPEAIVFAVAAPVFHLFLFNLPLKKRILNFLSLSSFIFSVIVLIALILIISSDFRVFINEHTPDQSVYFSLSFLLGNFEQGVDNFVEHVLVWDYSAKYASLILAGGLTTMLIYKIIMNLGIVYTAVWIIGSYKKWLTLRIESWMIIYFIVIAFTILMVLNITRFYVSSRYIILLVIFAGLIASQYLDYLLASLYHHKQKLLLGLIAIFFSVQILDALISIGASKAPIKMIAQWAIAEIEPSKKIACNEPRLIYYSEFRCIDEPELRSRFNADSTKILIKKDYDFLMIWFKHNNQNMIDTLNHDTNLTLIKHYANKKNDIAALYAIKKP